MKSSDFVTFIFLTLGLFFVEKCIAGPKLIVVMIDGVKWDYLNDPKLKGFQKIAESGVKASYVVPIFPSISYPNWYTITTGLYAENHGFVNNKMYDNATNLFFKQNPDPDATNPIWWNEAEPIWITAEKNNLRTAMYWWGGCEVRINNAHPMICERERFGPPTPEEREDFIERIDDIIEMFKPSKNFPNDRLSLVMMYYGPTDYAGHHSGPKSKDLKEALYDIDGILDKMQKKLKSAGLKDQVNIMVVSDHGMTDVSDVKNVDLEQFREDIKYQVCNGADSMIVPKEGKLDKLYNDMKAANLKGVDIYKKEDIPTKYHVKKGKRMTDLYLIANPGFSIKDLSKNNGDVKHKYVGSHGYDPAVVEDMRTIFLATGPAFKTNYKTEGLNMTDLYNIMCNVLQLNPLPNNGSWDKVKSMLKLSESSSEYKETDLRKSDSSINRNHYICSLLGVTFSIIFGFIKYKYI